MQICSIITVTDFACYNYRKVACISLQQQMAGAHIRNQHSEKNNNLLYISSFQLSLTTNIMFITTCYALKTWFELSRVQLYRNDLKGNKSYFELARVKLQYKCICMKEIQRKLT